MPALFRLGQVVERLHREVGLAELARQRRDAIAHTGADQSIDGMTTDDVALALSRFERLSQVPAQRHIDAQITGLWSNATRDGLERNRWSGPGATETFYMAVRVSEEEQDAIAPELYTNINQNLNPWDYVAHPMTRIRREGDRAIYAVTVPIERVGNYKVMSRIATHRAPDGTPTLGWSTQAGIPELVFRPRPIAHERRSEYVVNVGTWAHRTSGRHYSTFRDLLNGLDDIVATGRNTIRLQPPFRSDRWIDEHPHDTRGSDYATTDYFAIDPSASQDVRDQGIPDWDRDRQREVANAEFWAFVRAAKARGLNVHLDIALNHGGHEFTLRDLFDDPVRGETVARNNFDQLAVNDDQRVLARERVRNNPYGVAEDNFPWLYQNRNLGPFPANHRGEMIGGGNNQWSDTLQWVHGGNDFGAREFGSQQSHGTQAWLMRVLKYWCAPPPSEPGVQPGDGVDGFRIDHGTNLPTDFYDFFVTQLYGLLDADRPPAIIVEDFNQGARLRTRSDAMESGWYREIIRNFAEGNPGGILGIVNSPYFFETLRAGNHDEPRIINAFGGDLRAAGRYIATLDLLGGITTLTMGDEFGESTPLDWQADAGVPPVLAQHVAGTLPEANYRLRDTIFRSGTAKTNDPSLREARDRVPLTARSQEDRILAFARHADDPSVPGVLVFTNLANADVMTNTFSLDGETAERIDPDGWYEAHNLMGDADANIWGRRIQGRELLEAGVTVILQPYELQALRLDRVA